MKHKFSHQQLYTSNHHGVRDLFNTGVKSEACITLHMLKIPAKLKLWLVMMYNALSALEGCCDQYKLKVACSTDFAGLKDLFYIYFLIGA